MTTAVVLIAFAAYIGILARAAIAVRNWLAVAAIVAIAAAIYAVTLVTGLDWGVPVGWLYSVLGFGTTILACAAMFGAGFFVPVMLAGAERKRFPLFVALLATLFAFELWRATAWAARYWFTRPDLWFAAGVAAYLVVKSRFFEDDPNTDFPRAA